jgi:small-conductance mechanosensitive channel
MQALVGFVMHTCAFFAYLAIFGVDVGHLVISLSSMALASAFVFGNTIKTVRTMFCHAL